MEIIRYKVKLNIQNYYFASFLRLINGYLKSIFLISFLFSIIATIILFQGNTRCYVLLFDECLIFLFISFIYRLVISTFTMFFFILVLDLIFFPLLKFLIARFYYQQEYIEYFFNEQEFGWEMAGNKLSYKIELIDSIQIYSTYIIIRLKLKKIILPFIADKKTIAETAQKLRKNSNYLVNISG